MNKITLGLGEVKRLRRPKMVLYIFCVLLCMQAGDFDSVALRVPPMFPEP
jgi:hypothetical protein